MAKALYIILKKKIYYIKFKNIPFNILITLKFNILTNHLKNFNLPRTFLIFKKKKIFVQNI